MTAAQARRQGDDHVSVDLVGGLRVRVGPVALGPRQLGGTKPRRLLLALLLARGAPVSKDRLVSLLWDDALPVACTATVETYICVLRKRLQPQTPSRTSLIETRAGGYRIDMSRVDLDVARCDLLAARALHPSVTPEAAVGPLRESLVSAGAPLLPDEPAVDWLEAARDAHDHRVRDRLVAAAEKVAGVAPDDAARWARIALDADPLDESAWHAYLRSKELSGEHAEGLRAYDQCRRRFADELGCAPGARLQELYGRLLAGADEGEHDLGSLIEAVVRLHHATREGRPSDSAWNAVSLEQARRTLAALLVGGAGPRRSIVHRASA